MKADPGLYLDAAAPGPGMVPVRVVEFADESEAAAYALADNRLTEKNPMLPVDVEAVLRQIRDEGGDVQVPGWSEGEIEAILSDAGVEDVKWKEFDESIGDGAAKGKQMKCPHCGEEFSA
jgi:formylmethanofuran dehydrogenase subunit E